MRVLNEISYDNLNHIFLFFICVYILCVTLHIHLKMRIVMMEERQVGVGMDWISNPHLFYIQIIRLDF